MLNLILKNKVIYIYNLYKLLFNKIKEDIDILDSIKNNINNYTKLGIFLGEGNKKIDEQKLIL